MNIAMSSVDYNTADLENREKLSFTKSCMERIYDRIGEKNGVLGAVIISTCNRTEIYLSLEDGWELNPFELLCECADIDFEIYENMYVTKTDNDVIRHLSELACGIKSQIWGEDQIITQVKDAAAFARSLNMTDSILEVMFRIAVSAGKKVKTLVDFKSDSNNSDKRAVNIIKSSLENPKVLVIGNGMVGRDVAQMLVKSGIDTTMTLRHYRHGENIIPNGVKTIDYTLRYDILSECDAVVSATLSPHRTIKYEKIAELCRIPKIFIDLAVPRDIDERVALFKNVRYYNIDDIGKNEIELSHKQQMEEINAILDKYIDDFYRWYSYKMRVNVGE